MSCLVLRTCQLHLGIRISDELNSACSVAYAFSLAHSRFHVTYDLCRSDPRQFVECKLNLFWSFQHSCTSRYSSFWPLQLWSTTIFSGVTWSWRTHSGGRSSLWYGCAGIGCEYRSPLPERTFIQFYEVCHHRGCERSRHRDCDVIAINKGRKGRV